MRWISLAVLFWLALLPAAFGQLGQITPSGQLAPLVGPAYVGPGDLVSGGIAWYGLRAYNAAKATALTTIATITRASDSTACTAKVNAAGDMDLTATPCAGSTTIPVWCNATTCSVTTLVDQIGAKNVAQATLAKAPVLTFNCLNTSKPCMMFTGSASQSLLLSSGGATASQPVTYSVVAIRTANFTTSQYFFGSINPAFTTGSNLYFSNAANLMGLNAGTGVTVAATDSVWHAEQGLANSTTSIINLDGTESGSLNANTRGLAASFTLGSTSATAANFLTGGIAEGGVFGTTNATDRGNLCHNQRIYWGLSGSC